MAATSERSERRLPAQAPTEPKPVGVEPELERAISEAGDSGRIGRRVFRNVRRIELWSVFKVSLVFYACMYAIVLAVIALAWAAASENGLITDIEGFVNDVGWDDWSFQGDQMFADTAFIGGVLVGVGAVLTTLAAALFNLVSEMLGGFRIIVIEEESVPSAPRTRRRLRHAAAARVRPGPAGRQRSEPGFGAPPSGDGEDRGLPHQPPPGWGPSSGPESSVDGPRGGHGDGHRAAPQTRGSQRRPQKRSSGEGPRSGSAPLRDRDG